MTDWVTISALATAGSTVLLAGVTFSSVRSASRAAEAAERAILNGMRPMLLHSRFGDPADKVFWYDGHWAHLDGGHAYAEVVDGNLYLAISVRNAGPGLGVLQGWQAWPERREGGQPHAEVSEFRPQLRDLVVPAGDCGYWHSAVRDREDPAYEGLCKAVEARETFTVEVLYSDHEGGQRGISRFTMWPKGEDGAVWLARAGRHWNLDRPDPR